MCKLRSVTFFSQHPYRNILARSQPPIDASQDIINAMATHENGITTVTFTRPLTSNDPDDLSLTNCRFFFYGWGGSADTTSRTIGRHESTPIISSDMVCLPSPTECKSIVCGWSLEAAMFADYVLGMRLYIWSHSHTTNEHPINSDMVYC